jgi:transcriptional regulator of acetoin/glycerol metabolism
MTDPLIQASNARQARLEAAKAAFFMSGGKIREVPSGVSTETPKAREVLSKSKGAEKGRAAVVARTRAITEQRKKEVQALADRGLNVSEAVRESGFEQSWLRRFAKKHGIEFVKGEGDTAALESTNAERAERRASLYPQIAEMAAKGASINHMAETLDVSRTLIMNAMRDFNIPRGPKMDLTKGPGHA